MISSERLILIRLHKSKYALLYLQIYIELEVQMKRIKVADRLSAAELKLRMLNSKDIQEHKRWQALYIAKTKGLSAGEIADMIGVSVYTINKWVYNYNHKGEQSIYSKPRGGNRTSFLSWEEEEELLQDISQRAERGLLVIVKTIKAEIESKIKHPVSKDYPYDLLHRHGWRRVVPRPKHPKQDPEQQVEFKKNSRNTWQPQH